MLKQTQSQTFFYRNADMITFIIIAIAVASCSSSTDNTANTDLSQKKNNELIIAQVGSKSIDLQSLKSFSASIPTGMIEGNTEREKTLQVLRSLIDKEVLLLEANSLSLDSDTAFQDELTVFHRNRLLELYTKLVIVDQVFISDADLDAHYRATDRHRALRYNGIMLENKAEAEKLLQKILAGEDFMELAKGHSLHRESGDQGGDVGGYHLKDSVHPAIADQLFKLSVGGTTEPISLMFKGKPHHAVFQVSDEMPVALSASERKVQEEVFGIKRAERYTILLDSLKNVYKPVIQDAAVDWIVENAAKERDDPFAVTSQWGDEPLCILQNGSITIELFLKTARQMHTGQHELADRERLQYLISEIVIPANLFETEARLLSLHEDENLISRVEMKREDLLLNALREKFVDSNITASDEEAKNFYTANPVKFTSPLTTEIAEVLVQSDTLAQRLFEEISNDAKIDSIAKLHTIREGAAHHDGKLSISNYTKAYYKDIFDPAQNNQVGKVVGPMKVPLGYSIFKVLDRKQEIVPYNASTIRRAKAYVRIDKSRRGYVSFVQTLRKKYGVEVYGDRLETTL